MTWFSSNNIKQLKLFSLASGGPTGLLIAGVIGNNLVDKGTISQKWFLIGMVVSLIGFIIALVIYAADKKKN